MRFPEFDHPRKPSIEVIDGVPTIINDRTVIEDLAVVEPLDERTDSFVSIPIRRVHTPGAGLSVEVGPFSLTSSDVVVLFNALAKHINETPGEFRMRPEPVGANHTTE